MGAVPVIGLEHWLSTLARRTKERGRERGEEERRGKGEKTKSGEVDLLCSMSRRVFVVMDLLGEADSWAWNIAVSEWW